MYNNSHSVSILPQLFPNKKLGGDSFYGVHIIHLHWTCNIPGHFPRLNRIFSNFAK